MSLHLVLPVTLGLHIQKKPRLKQGGLNTLPNIQLYSRAGMKMSATQAELIMIFSLSLFFLLILK